MLYRQLDQTYTSREFADGLNKGYFSYAYHKQYYAFTSLAIPFALNTFNQATEKFGRTFIVMLNDGAFNVQGSGVDPNQEFISEVSQANFIKRFGQEQANEVVQLRDQQLVGYNLRRLSKGSRSAKRYFPNGRASYQGEYYYLTVYELVPNLKGATLPGIIDYLQKDKGPLRRLPNGQYMAEWSIGLAANKPAAVVPLTLDVQYLGSDDKVIHSKQFDISHTANTQTIQDTIPQLGNEVTVRLSLTARYENPHYNGTILNPGQYPALTDEFTWQYEEDERFLGGAFRLRDWMYRLAPKGNNQKASAAFYEWLSYFTFFALGVLVAIQIVLLRKPNVPKPHEFTVESQMHKKA